MKDKGSAFGARYANFLAERVPCRKHAVFLRALRDGVDLRMIKGQILSSTLKQRGTYRREHPQGLHEDSHGICELAHFLVALWWYENCYNAQLLDQLGLPESCPRGRHFECADKEFPARLDRARA